MSTEHTRVHPDLEEEEQAPEQPTTSRGIPAPRRPGDSDTGDTFTATSERGTTAGPGFGSVVTVPGEGGVPSRDEE